MSFGAGAKKDGTNVFCSCREASDANYFQRWCDQEDRSPSLEYLHDTIDRLRSKYKISDFLVMRDGEPSGRDWHLRTAFGKKQGMTKPDSGTRHETTSDLKSSSSVISYAAQGPKRRPGENRGWVKVGAIAAASAVLGGLATVWFYRKALSQLREAENEIPDSDSEITEDERAEDF
jgi:hypothetical protein